MANVQHFLKDVAESNKIVKKSVVKLIRSQLSYDTRDVYTAEMFEEEVQTVKFKKNQADPERL